MPRGVVWADVALASDSVDATGTDYVLTGNLELYSLLTPVTDETDEPAPAPSETDAG